MTAEAPAPTRTPMMARCGSCSHTWPILYLPMEAGLAARMVKAARCPVCGTGSRNIFMAPDAVPAAVPT